MIRVFSVSSQDHFIAVFQEIPFFSRRQLQRHPIVSGDRIVKIADRKISDIYDFMYSLEDALPGEAFAVIAVRGDEELEFSVVLQVRNVQR